MRELNIYQSRDISSIKYIFYSFFSGSIRALHLPQHPCSLHWLRFPNIHVKPSPPQLRYLLRPVYELLHSELQETTTVSSQEG